MTDVSITLNGGFIFSEGSVNLVSIAVRRFCEQKNHPLMHLIHSAAERFMYSFETRLHITGLHALWRSAWPV